MDRTFKVPIRNLFCLLSYVNEMPDLVESFNDVDEDLITYDFLAKRFNREVKALLRRGIVKNYITLAEPTNRLGGRVLMNESMPYIMAKKPIVVCEKDEYSGNIVLNQVMKAMLASIYVNRFVKEETRKESFFLFEQMPEVEPIPLTKELLTRIHFSRYNVHYKRMIHLARLLHELILLSHKSGNWSLFSAEVDDTSLNQIFEKFLLNFYRLEQRDYRVGSEQLQWKLEGNTTLLPVMRTDVSLTHKSTNEKIVIDAKFYKRLFQEHFGKATFHSHNLYQMYTYLMHQPQDIKVRGILIYPENGFGVKEAYRWDERMTLEVMSLDLDAGWKEIYDRLITVLSK